MMKQAMYWSGAPGLAPQQIVEPGSYWRRVMNVSFIEAREQAGAGRVATPNTQMPAVLLEAVLEWVRLTEFPTLPSRAHCNFVWEREDWAREYHAGLPSATLYEVQPMGGARVFRADYTLGNAFRENDTLVRLVERARRYWRAELEGRPELLVEGSLLVLRAVLTPTSTRG